MNIVIVEDDPQIASFLSRGLRAEGYATSVISDGESAARVVPTMAEDIDLVLLDLGLPLRDGKSVLAQWRADKFAKPVIILTARDEVAEKVKGLNAGATDYVTKPFSFDELLARIRAALRTYDSASLTTLEVADVTFDMLSKVAFRGGKRIELAQREWSLLELFMRNPHQVLSRIQILNHVWDYSFDPGSNIVDVYVGYLRKKINIAGHEPLIQTVRGAGYRFIPPSSSFS
ncbi:MAG: response regulator transcription factor [Actinomycetota bacterium]|nr:response regulator transcription factor [Actinomycetota bacterium]MDA8208057.1 response regulator transcription factor [Actinomycetota bacterium]